MTVLKAAAVVLLLLAITAALIFALWLRHMARTHGALVLLGRWHIGRPLGQRPPPGAPWTPQERARAAIRAGAELALLLALAGLVVARTVTIALLACTAAGAAILCVVHLVTRIRTWRHERHYVRPLERTLMARIAAAPETLQVERAGDEVKAITVTWPAETEIGPAEQDAVLQAVTTRLAIEAPDDDWNIKGRNRTVTFTRSQPPPPRVTPRDILPAVRDAAEHEVILGVGKKDQLIDVSLDTESPHIGMCMTTGDGKSTAAMNVAAQLLHHGGLVAFLDYKLMSHMWARGLPNVAYAGTPAEIHELLCWLAFDDDAESELTRRKKVALAAADIRGNVRADLGPRILVVAEELNATQKRLKAYWRRSGGKGPSPAAEALDEVMFTGRQLRVHALQIGQRLSAKASGSDGSSDARENLGAIVFSNPSASTWKMLCDGHAQPPASGHKGRYQVVTRKSVREMQGALWDEQEARDFATAGVVGVPRHDMPFTAAVPGVPASMLALHGGPDLPFVAGPPVPAAPPGTGAVTLREAADAGLFPSVAAARKAVQRAALEPAGQRGAAGLFVLDELRGIIRR